jgi:hypothetical protein
VKLLRRILLTVFITLAVIFVGVQWIAPAALSFYAVRNALPVARIVPTDLKDKSVSETPGKKLSYFGYEFDVPWSDLDETQTKLYPNDKPDKTRVDLRFRSGLRVLVSAIPPRSWATELSTDFKVPLQRVESSFGESDYSFVKALYEFTPEKMNHWSLSHRVHDREEFLLLVKSIALPRSAETGIFNLQNRSYKGFQDGNPQVRQDEIIVHLFSEDGSVEMIFLQKDYQNPNGVSQPEINRIVQSLHKATQVGAAASQMAKR